MTHSDCSIAARVLEKLHNGDSISDKELKIAVKTISSTIVFIDCLPKEYSLMGRALRADLSCLEGYLEWRKADA